MASRKQLKILIKCKVWFLRCYLVLFAWICLLGTKLKTRFCGCVVNHWGRNVGSWWIMGNAARFLSPGETRHVGKHCGVLPEEVERKLSARGEENSNKTDGWKERALQVSEPEGCARWSGARVTQRTIKQPTTSFYFNTITCAAIWDNTTNCGLTQDAECYNEVRLNEGYTVYIYLYIYMHCPTH